MVGKYGIDVIGLHMSGVGLNDSINRKGVLSPFSVIFKGSCATLRLVVGLHHCWLDVDLRQKTNE